MSVVQSPTTALLAALVLAAFAVSIAAVWRLEGRARWRAILTDRFYYGVPWGTLVVVAFVLAVYLLLQGGLRHWSDPLVLPFRAWSYLYPTGVLAAGFSHASPNHLIGNLIGTIVLAPIAEYAWGHYPSEGRDPPAAASGNRRLDAYADGGESSPGAPSGYRARLRATLGRWLRTPWIRASVCFPLAVLAVGLITSLFFLGPVIGFSGVVFAFGGFALIHYPVTTMVALLLSSVVNTTYRALQDPIVQQGISGGAPSPPWWAEIAVQAHALGVIVGVLLGLALLLARDRRPRAGRVFLAILVYGFTRNLWAVYWFAGDGQYVLFRGVGVALVVVLALLVTAAAAASDRPLAASIREVVHPVRRRLSVGVEPLRQRLRNAVGPLRQRIGTASVRDRLGSSYGEESLRSRFPRRDLLSRRRLAWASLALYAVLGCVAVVGMVVRGWSLVFDVLPALLVLLVLSVPPLNAVTPGSGDSQPLTSRQAAVGALVLVAALLGGVAVFPNLVTTGEDAVPGSGELRVEDYAVTYEERVENRLIPAIEFPGAAAATQTRTSGVIVHSPDRHIWTRAVSQQYLASEGSATVTVGGPGWRDTVEVERRGWNVQGNGSVYVVDLAAGNDRVRSFESGARRAEPRVGGYNLSIAPADDGFAVSAERSNETVDRVPIPLAGNDSTLASLTVRTDSVNGRDALFAVSHTDDGENATRVRIATRERYRDG